MNITLSKPTGMLAQSVRATASRLDTALGMLSVTPAVASRCLAELAALRREARELEALLKQDRKGVKA